MEIIDKMPLCNECDSSNFPYTCVECGDAFMLAMEALKQPDIVRCKDCKNKEKDGISEGFHYCNINGLQVTDDWFCADGERKE